MTHGRPAPALPAPHPGRAASGPIAPLGRWGGWALLALSVACYAAVWSGMRQPFHAGGLPLRFFDLRIYHLAALRLVHGAGLYGAPMLDHLGFTYPPFAALVLAPLAAAPLRVDELGVTGLNVLLLIAALRWALLLPDGEGRPGRDIPAVRLPAPAWSLAAGLAAAALWLEPISVTLGYGQINLLITTLVVFDLSRPDDARAKGAGIGLAAAIKLTPLLFIAYLLFSRRARAAGVAAATFLATIALSFALAGRDAAAYWGHEILHSSRVGSPSFAGDQSLHGIFARWAGATHSGSSWELAAVVVAVAGLALAVAAARRGDEAAGFSLAALTALLISPISWSHHWAIAVPALVLLARRAYERRSRALAAAALLGALVGYAYLPEIAEGAFASAHGFASLATTDPYPLVALGALAGSAVWALRRPPKPTGARRDRTILMQRMGG